MKEAAIIFISSCTVFLGAFIYTQNTHRHLLATIFKGLASLSFFLLPIVGILLESNKSGIVINVYYAINLFIGLGFGVAGDILLNLRDLFKNPAKNYISIAGIISFFIGHLFYLFHLLRIVFDRSFFTFVDESKFFIPVIIALIITASIGYLIFKFLDKPTEFKIGAIIYVFVISLLTAISLYTLIYALNSNVNNKMKTYSTLYFIGLLAFSISDVVLIFNSFGKHPRALVSALNLVVYYAGQIIIGIATFYFLIV